MADVRGSAAMRSASGRSGLPEISVGHDARIKIALCNATGGMIVCRASEPLSAYDAISKPPPRSGLSRQRFRSLRGKPSNPRLIRDEIEPTAAVHQLSGECDWLFLDTAPAMMDQVELAVEAADFVLIPVLASAFDLVAGRAVVALCGEHNRRFAFVLNRANPRRELLHSSAAIHLRKVGVLLAEHVQDRVAYVSALNKGLTGPEHPDSKQSREARSEIQALWEAVKKMAVKARAQ
jgi:cellulose biosynthesis protein BcsQ